MDSREIKDLLNFVRKADFDEFEMELEGFRLRVVRGRPNGGAGAPSVAPTISVSAPAHPQLAEAPPASLPAGAAAAPVPVEPQEKLHEQKSPMVGTFYRAASPGAAPLAAVGDRVAAGQKLCIIEAMKLMNEIEAEISGTIVEIVPENAQPVEFGEVLFRFRPDR